MPTAHRISREAADLIVRSFPELANKSALELDLKTADARRKIEARIDDALSDRKAHGYRDGRFAADDDQNSG
jgi:hypothetical protein